MSEATPQWDLAEYLETKPSVGVFGYRDQKGHDHPADSIEQLCELILHSREEVAYVWTPEAETYKIPEEIRELDDVLWQRAQRYARRDCADARKLGLLFGAVVLWSLLWSWQRYEGDLEAIVSYPSLGISLILLFIFGALPWYEGQKVLRAGKLKATRRENAIAEVKFDIWMEKQPVAATRFLIGLLIIVGLGQLWIVYGAAGSGVKAAVLKPELDWWRYATTTFLHGNVLHWLMNASALLFLARRVEVLANWPHLFAAYGLSMIAGSLSSVYWDPQRSTVGASGAILGLLGFLLVFEWKHKDQVPKGSRKRLAAGLVSIVLLGVFGFSFMDNAAHAGGLLAGGVYAFVVFPRGGELSRAKTSGYLSYFGWFLVLLFTSCAGYTLLKLLMNR